MLDILFIGLTLGAVYALVSAGLTLLFGVLGVVNFAHGELFLLGALGVYLAQSLLGVPYLAGGLIAITAMILVGYLMYIGVIRPIIDRPWQSSLIATLALSVLIVNGVTFFAGSTPRRVSTGYEAVQFEILGVPLSGHRVLIVLIAILVFLGLFLVIKKTKIGTAMRAVSQNREACYVVGIDVKKVVAVTVVVAVLLAGIAGVLVAPIFSVWPQMGIQMTFKAFAIVIMGGFGRIEGAILAAVIVGIIEAFSAAYIGLAFKDMFVFVALLLVLMIRPAGLLGTRERAA